MDIITFFNNKGGVGKTTLLYNLAHKLANMGKRVVVMDLDPQANATAMFLTEERFENALDNQKTIMAAIRPLMEGISDLQAAPVIPVCDNLSLVAGDLDLSTFEHDLSGAWLQTTNPSAVREFRVWSAFYRITKQLERDQKADFVFIDVGPNLGPINRAALTSSDWLIVPIGADRFSIQGLRNLGENVLDWSQQWNQRLEGFLQKHPSIDLELPTSRLKPLGYVLMQHMVRDNKPTKAFELWADRIPASYGKYVLKKPFNDMLRSEHDENFLAQIKNYNSLVPLAHEKQKPIFALNSRDLKSCGSIKNVVEAEQDFTNLAKTILKRIKILNATPPIPPHLPQSQNGVSLH